MTTLLRALGCLLLLKPLRRRAAAAYLMQMLSEQFAEERKSS